MNSAELGRKGEAVAAKYYLNRGYQILEHNYRTRLGELDLILQKENQIIVCEVKTRAGSKYGVPAEAVNKHKQHCITLATNEFLQKNDLFDAFVQFDVVEVTPDEMGWHIHCISNAFGEA